MKQLFLFSFLLFATPSFGQTNVIALKSHAGDLASITTETDNFGLPARIIDSIIYVGNECILEVSHHFDGYYSRDTVCEPYLFVEHNFDLEKVKPMYSSHVVFIGFENYDSNSPKQKKSQRSKGGIPLMIIFVLGAAYFFRKQKSLQVD